MIVFADFLSAFDWYFAHASGPMSALYVQHEPFAPDQIHRRMFGTL